MIIVSGINLVAAGPKTTANAFLIGTTLIFAVGIPIYSGFVLGKEWLDQLPIFLKLLAGNGVVLAVLLAVGLNMLLNFGLEE
jgi:xanthine/uracil permease